MPKEHYELATYGQRADGKGKKPQGWLEPWRRTSLLEKILLGVLVLIPVVCGSVIGVLSNTQSYIGKDFAQPSWRPPSWLFAPAWTVLYLLMGTASAFVYVYGGGLNRRTFAPFFFYGVQLAANFAWTPVFFGAGYAGGGVVIISAMWAFCVACVVTFTEHSITAAILMVPFLSRLASIADLFTSSLFKRSSLSPSGNQLVPYLSWLSFATALNLSVVCLNSCVIDTAGTTTAPNATTQSSF